MIEIKFSAKTFLQLRKEKKLSNATISKMTGIAASYLWRLENTVTNPSIEVVNKLGEALGVVFVLESKE